MRISDFLDIKFDTVDTVVGTAVTQLLWAPCGGFPNASGHSTLTDDSSRARGLDVRNRPILLKNSPGKFSARFRGYFTPCLE